MEVDAPSNPPVASDSPADTNATTPKEAQDHKEPAHDDKPESASHQAKEDVNTDDASEAPQTNGAGDRGDSEVSASASKASEPAADMKAEDDAPASSTPATNGTPASNKRASVGGSSKKKSSGIPEHKSKKVNKKKSRPMTNLEAKAGEYFFARMKGHPPWPSIICDEEMLPSSLLTTRPVTAALPDGTFKKPEYADGGKRSYERTFPVMFLHTNEFAWIPNTELTPLDVTSEAVKTPPEKGKAKTLLAAYAKAAEASDLAVFKKMLADHQQAIEEDLAAQEERAAKKTEKTKKSKSSEAAANDDDGMDVDEDEAAEKPKSKKRKKVADDSDADEKPPKTPKTSTKLKLTRPKQPTESATKKKASKSKSKAAKPSSDEEAMTPKVDERPPSPGAAREIKEKKVLYYRHKLQRGFLSRDTVPKVEEMKSMSDFLGELETFVDLEGSIIRVTKIHKVLKQMIKLENIPLEEDFKFKDRSSRLLARWNETLSNEDAGEEKGEGKEEDREEGKDEPGAGSKADDKEQSKLDDKSPDLASEPTKEATPAVNGDSKRHGDTGSKEEEEEEEKEPESDGEDGMEVIDVAKQGGKKTAEAAAPDSAQDSKDSDSNEAATGAADGAAGEA